MKTYILDTNVLLSDGNSLFGFEEHNLVLPLIVLEELDRHKDRQDEVGRNAREVVRKLAALTKINKDFKSGIPLGKNLGQLRILSINDVAPFDTVKLPEELETKKSGDNTIAQFCTNYIASHTEETVILVTRDTILRLKAQALGITCEDYRKFNVATSANSLYSGVKTIEREDVSVGDYYAAEEFYLPADLQEELHPNQFVILKSGQQSAMARFTGKGEPLRDITPVPGKLTPRNKEQEFARELLYDPEVKLVTLAGKAGTGKAQPLDAKILTPTGWTTMGQIKPGDTVIGQNGKATKVLSIHPQGEKDIYRITFSDRSYTECCLEHLWHTKTQKERDKGQLGSVRNLQEIIGSLRHTTGNGKTVKRNHSIPMVEPVEFAQQDTPIDPYLLGVLLGDGCMSIDTQIGLSTADKEMAEKCATILSPLALQIKKKAGRKYDYSITKRTTTKSSAKNSLLEALRLLHLMGSLSYEKFVPRQYIQNTASVRLQVLQGLMDTDGFVGKDGTDVVFYSTSTQLAKDVQEIVWSLGGKATISEKQTSYTHKGLKKLGRPSFAVHISVPSNVIPFTLSRKLDRFKPRTKYQPTRYIDTVELIGKKEAQCIVVDAEDHLYITDDYVVTHNTLLAIDAGLEQVLNMRRYRSLVICRPVMPVGRDIGFLPGDLSEKLEPWLAPIKDNLRFLLGDNSTSTTPTSKKSSMAAAGKGKFDEAVLQSYFDEGIIEVQPLTFIRGRSIANAFIIIDETQNTNLHEIKTILTRVGENTKIVLTGDVEQIDSTYVDSVSNGLSIVIERFKEQRLAGSVTFLKGERSALATLAASILGD